MEIYVKDNKALSLDSKFLAPAKTGETWVLNATGSIRTSGFQDILFNSNNSQFTSINTDKQGFRYVINYDDTTVATGILGDDTIEYDAWINDAYRTLTFPTPPTGDLLTWLQANGTKQ